MQQTKMSINDFQPSHNQSKKSDVNTMSRRAIRQILRKNPDVFSPAVFSLIPEFLKEVTGSFDEKYQKSASLLTATTVLGAAFPNCQIKCGKFYNPNLMFIHIGAAAGGKSHIVNLCTELIRRIDHEKRAQHARAMAEFRKEKKEGAIPPPEEMLIFSINSNPPKVFQVWAANEGRGLFIVHEIDTAANANKRENDEMSPLYRAAIEHDPVDYSTKSGGTIKIDRPASSFLLCGTPAQLPRLIPSTENGLYSRAMYYDIKSDKLFNMFDFDTEGITAKFKQMGVPVAELYNVLDARDEDNPIEFILSKKQEQLIFKAIKKMYEKLSNKAMPDLKGMVKRQTVTIVRLAMILTILEMFEKKDGVWHAPKLEDKVPCSMRSVLCAILMLPTLINGSLEAYGVISKKVREIDMLREIIPNIENVQKAFQLKSRGLSNRKISKEIFGTDTKSGTINRWLNDERYIAYFNSKDESDLS